MNRRHFLMAIATLAMTACSTQNTNPPVALAKDKPTLLYFWTPN